MTDADEELFDAATSDDHRPEAAVSAPRRHDGDPDVLLDVPQLRVDEISLEVQDLKARVSLQASVLDLLNLHVGVDAVLGRVGLTIKGVEAQALLKVHLDNVARILERVLTTIDNNPEIVERLVERVGGAVEGVGTGAGQAIGDLGDGAGSAVEGLGEGAGTAVGDVGRGAGTAVEDVGRGAGGAVEDVGEDVGTVAEDLDDEAGARLHADKDTEAEARPRRRTKREAEERPRRRRRTESTEGPSRKTSRRSRDRGPENS
jgi:hypothetical protein